MNSLKIKKLLSFFFFVLFIFFFSFSFMDIGSGKLLYFSMMDFLYVSVDLIFLIDRFSLMFCSIVSLIVSVVIWYSIFYMGFLYSNRFIYLVFLFSVSMIILIFSGNFFMIMLGWDGLGLISFSLVIYYQNEVSVKSGLLTIFMNRFGDGAMMFYMCLFFMFNMNVISIGVLVLDEFSVAIFLFFMGCFSSSAQFPFMSWLPAAMTAPTPVSSLVHSSTLVTAGVYLMMRFNYFFFDYFFNFVSFFSLLTMGVGGFLAMVEIDFKSVIAFSTLSQLGLMVFVLSNGESNMCFFHLLSHAIFKSFLFMVCGIYMFISFGSQDSRLMGLKFPGTMFFQMIMMFSCLNLGGFPISLGFLSKDLILESFMGGFISVVNFFFFFFSCCFTVCYSISIFSYIIFYMKVGFSLFSLNSMFYGSEFFFILCFFMCLWGVVIEEFLIDVDFYTFFQDFKVLDILIFLFGVFLWFFMDVFMFFGFSMLDYFWVSVFLNFFGYNFYKLEINGIFMVSYYLNFLLIDVFSLFFLKNYYYFNYLFNLSNLFFLNFSFLLFYFFY